MKKELFQLIIVAMLSLGLLAACGEEEAPAPTVAPAASVDGEAAPTAVSESSDAAAETAVPTPIPATPTPSEPLAATVNGQPILLSTYEKELSRYEQAQAELGTANGSDNYRVVVLNSLVERELIRQAAAAAGIAVSDEMVTQQMDELRTAAGGADNFNAWLDANQWTEDEFREALAVEMVTEQMVAQVTSSVPTAVEQIRARYLQVSDPALAAELLTQLQNGADFATLAAQHSLDQATAQNGGDLGFFARGSLLIPELEEAAFALQPGELSDVISAPNQDGEMRHYVLEVTERDPQRPLPADLQYTVLQEAFEAWLATERNAADIQLLVNTDA